MDQLLLLHLLTATSYHSKKNNSSVLLTNVGCSGSESNLSSCCAREISSSLYCHSGLDAGVVCEQYKV